MTLTPTPDTPVTESRRLTRWPDFRADGDRSAQAGRRREAARVSCLGQGTIRGADLVGTVHDMRFVILDNDTKLLFASAYDGDWDSYITAFATKIPDAMDALFSVVEGWPGIHSDSVKDFIAQHQIRQPDGMWLTRTRRLRASGRP